MAIFMSKEIVLMNIIKGQYFRILGITRHYTKNNNSHNSDIINKYSGKDNNSNDL
jgi:hypothetical protein